MNRSKAAILAVPLVFAVPPGARGVEAAYQAAHQAAHPISEDEDAYWEMELSTHEEGGGTGWVNQVITELHGTSVSNSTTGWMTFYGLPKTTSVTLELAEGECGTALAALARSGPVRTDHLGGWHGEVGFELGASPRAVADGGYHVRLLIGGKPGGCGMLRDDPDIGE